MVSILSAFCPSLLASLISALYLGTSGRDLMVLVIMGACASRVPDTVLYKLTSSLGLTGLCWHRADFCRLCLNGLISMLLVFLCNIYLTVSDGFLIIKSLMTVKRSENRLSAIGSVDNRLSAHLVIVRSGVRPDL